MEKEIKEVADLQRKRLKKVIDPMQSIMAIDNSGYIFHLVQKINEHGQYHRDGNALLTNMPWIVLSCIPLSYLTKSIAIPMYYFMGSFTYLIYREVINKDCWFCRPTLRELEQVSMTGEPSVYTINELNIRRQQIMMKVFART